MRSIRGIAHVCGDDIDTDRILPGKYTKTLDLQQLAEHVLEDLDPDLGSRIGSGDILVAGHNFGCGSSREQAPLALQAAGIAAVVATSFARIFFRNAINIGLPVAEVESHAIQNGSLLTIDLADGEIQDESCGRVYGVAPLSPLMRDILQAGGLVHFIRAERDGWCRI